MNKTNKLWLLTATATIVLNTSSAGAQAVQAGRSEIDAATQTPTDEAVAKTTTTGQVADIIVTAQRRSERLQDVPVAVTVIGTSQLQAVGVQSSIDLRIAAPSLNSTNASGFVANSIRGVGSLGYAPGLESPVGLYIDGVYLAAPQAGELTLNSVENIEVLKGPQGTLFGRNATGGLIQITTATPGSTFKGNANVSYGNLNTLVGSLYLSGPLSKDLAADIAVSGRRRDGIGKNLFDGKDVGAVGHDVNARSKIVWTPGAETTITAIGNYWDGEDTNGWFVGYPGKTSGFVPGFVAPDLGYDANTDRETRQIGWSALGALKIQQDVGNVRIVSTSAYRRGVLDLVRDLDFTDRSLVALRLQQKDKQFSQELQFSSIGKSRLRYTAGLYYFYLGSQYSPLDVDLSLFAPVGADISSNERQKGRSFAGYGQATYEIVPDTNLTLGGRYTTERRTTYDATQTITIPAANIVIPASFPDRSQTARKFTYRISLDHRFSDEVLAYASFNTGFKSGGYNTGAPGEPGYGPENLYAYEVGIKTDLLDRRLRVNVSSFYYDYKDIQVQRLGLASLIVFNGAQARIYGVDADFTAVLSPEFSVTGGLNWIDTRFQNFPQCPLSSPAGGVPLSIGSCAGNQVPFAAKFSGSLTASYTRDVGTGKLAASGNMYYNSGYFFETDNVLRQTRYAKLGASLKWTALSGVSVGVYGRNLTDRRTLLLAGSQTSGNTSAAYADPREYGVSLGYKF